MNGKSEAVLIGFDAPEADDPADLARHAIDFWLTTEDLPLPENRVLLDRDGRSGCATRRPTCRAPAAHRQVQGLLDTMQCRDEVLPNYSYRGGRLGVWASPTRTARCASAHDPATSALDVNCKMHELDNLYVADSSFFVQLSREPDADHHRQRAARRGCDPRAAGPCGRSRPARHRTPPGDDLIGMHPWHEVWL